MANSTNITRIEREISDDVENIRATIRDLRADVDQITTFFGSEAQRPGKALAKRGRKMVAKHPTASLAGAFWVGALLALAMRPSRSRRDDDADEHPAETSPTESPLGARASAVRLALLELLREYSTYRNFPRSIRRRARNLLH